MQKAKRIRKVMGGAMRQIGFMAAAGLYAIQNNVERLANDHQKAKEIANALKKQSYIYKVEPVETNIVIFYLQDNLSITEFMDSLSKLGVKISSMGQGKLRIVTHLDYTDVQHLRFKEILDKLKF
jgi:threonine aldolase